MKKLTASQKAKSELILYIQKLDDWDLLSEYKDFFGETDLYFILWKEVYNSKENKK